MSKNLAIWLVVILAVVLGIVYLVGYKSPDNGQPVAPPAPQATAPAPAPKSGGTVKLPAGGHTALQAVSIRGYSFTPEVTKITAGTKVIWTNYDSTSHTVTSDTGVFSSTVVNKGGTFSYVFTKKGVYPYSCTIHRNMRGSVVVD